MQVTRNDEYAIYVQDAVKSYGQKVVLNKLSMKVPKGCIYGLLGASGCGKTTLLSCIVGRKHLDSGKILTLGGTPGTKGSGVPGARVGYMPQDIALVMEFTVKDAVYYFGRILNMHDDLIYERFQKLKKLLDLPPDDRYIKNCSGGQQRRVSFAAAMVHKPELLILDEPTVGLDPVLRESIWNHLVEITEKEQVAVIITTHYIEEARQAHKIGLMREGSLLAEDSPEHLLSLFQMDNLEEVFLALSIQQRDGQPTEINCLPADSQNNTIAMSRFSSFDSVATTIHASKDVLIAEKESKNNTKASLSLNKRRMKSLLVKNAQQFYRNLGSIGFTTLFPLIQMMAFLLAVGGNVKYIPIGIINEESIAEHCTKFTKNGTTLSDNQGHCYFQDLGCRFIKDLSDPMFNLITYDKLDDAFVDIKDGKLVGVMHVADNFTESYEQKFNDNRKLSDATLENSRIKVWLDMSNRQIGPTVKQKLLNKFIDFQVDTVTDCDFDPKLGKIPLRFDFQYGSDTESYTIFMVPGVLLTVIYFMATILTSQIIITDRLEGVWDRSIVAGVSSIEIVITHFIFQFLLVLFQVVEVLILTFGIFGIEYLGKMSVIFVYTLLQGLAGMVFGFWLSIISNSQTEANVYGTGCFYPMVLMCGMMWPLEAQPIVLRYISQCLPFTIPIIQLRNVIKKGYEISNPEIIIGIVIPLIWIIGLTITSIFSLKKKR